jgi:O-antigen/teichoic acid export membrane protein
MPHLWERFGASGDAKLMERQVMIPTVAVSTFMPVVAGLLYLAIPFLILVLRPEYRAATTAAQYLALGGSLQGLGIASTGLLVALNKEWVVTANRVAGGLVIAGGTWAVLHGVAEEAAVARLTTVALVSTSGYFLVGMLNMTQAMQHFWGRSLRLVGNLALLHLPYLWVMGALWVAYTVVPTVEGSLGWEILHLAARMMVFIVLCLPVMWWGNHKTQLGQRVRDLVRHRWPRRKSD